MQFASKCAVFQINLDKIHFYVPFLCVTALPCFIIRTHIINTGMQKGTDVGVNWCWSFFVEKTRIVRRK